ncbi:MAG: reverse transcriptase domain-containing protein [Limnoraphis robusta]
MTEPRSFHPLIQEAYTGVHQWLSQQEEATGYSQVPYPYRDQAKMDELLTKESLKMVAAQFSFYFHAHYFKVIHTFDQVLTKSYLLNWVEQNKNICILDIGCGGGTGSIAFLETLIRLKEEGILRQSLNIYCLGIDVNEFTLVIYNQFMTELKPKLATLNINCEFDLIADSVLEACYSAKDYLQNQLTEWNCPTLPRVLMIHSTVVDMLEKQYQRKLNKNANLKKYDILTDKNQQFTNFSKNYSLVYRQIFEEVPIDQLSVITIGTHRDSTPVKVMGDALDKEFSKKCHSVTLNVCDKKEYQVYYKNPQGSNWRNEDPGKPSTFYLTVVTISNQHLAKDKDWQTVTSLENLELAWVHARHYLLHESFFDDVEIRLFERNLTHNLKLLQQQLMAYVEEVAHHEDYLNYKSVKSSSQGRPRGLSRFEGEILSVAIIQKLGQNYSRLQGNSYAYRIDSKNYDIEYFYSYWYFTYDNFIKNARDNAKNYKNAVVIRVDIESFYTKIIQDHLTELTGKELSESKRISWLLKVLLQQELNEHEIGSGITQGSIGSGFYANLYLKDVDAIFGSQPTDNQWGATLYRYVDDMIIIVPDPNDKDEVLNILTKTLSELGLKLNPDKTEIYTRVEDFLETVQEDQLLNDLKKNFDDLTNLLWIGSSSLRREFERSYRTDDDDLWWHLIKRFKSCLNSIQIYVNAPRLSRKVYQFLFDSEERKTKLNNQQELVFPEIPYDDLNDSILNWARTFESLNCDWIQKKNELINQLIRLFKDNLTELKALQESHSIEPRQANLKKRTLIRQIRFAINRLYLLGLQDIRKEIVDILCDTPWIFREPLQVIENLARQGGGLEVVEILGFYKHKTTSYSESMTDETTSWSEYIRAVTLRGIRFLPAINKYVWEKMVEYSTKGTTIECLMATETWLHLSHVAHQFTTDDHINAVYQALESDPLVKRLRKNYILILGMYDKEINREVLGKDSDYMLDEALKVAREGSNSDLFEYEEPKIIRDKYYSGKRQFKADGESELMY